MIAPAPFAPLFPASVFASTQDPYELTAIRNAHTESVRSLLIVPDSGHLASCAFDGSIKIWDYNYDEDDDDSGGGSGGEGGGDDRGSANTEGKAAGHGSGRVLHEYNHSTAQFRCLVFSKVKSAILAGTERGDIYSFPLPSWLASPQFNPSNAPNAGTSLTGNDSPGPAPSTRRLVVPGGLVSEEDADHGVADAAGNGLAVAQKAGADQGEATAVGPSSIDSLLKSKASRRTSRETSSQDSENKGELGRRK